MIPQAWLDQADERLAGKVTRTPLTFDPRLNIYLKWENRQQTGSFKIRGALNKVLSLSNAELSQGLVTASAGNHGQGVAMAAGQVGASVVVFAAKSASSLKIDKMRKLGAQVELVDGSYTDAERTGIHYAREHKATWVSPYNDAQVICGQATLGSEMLDQLEGKDLPKSVIVSGGGGGLLAGLGARLHGKMKVYGVSSEASPYLYQLYHTGSQSGVLEMDSLADGLAGAVEEGSITVPLTRATCDDFILVNESSVSRAIAYAWYAHGEIIEGSAAVALAAVLDGKIHERPGLVVISGGNILPELHARICEEWKESWF